MKGQKKPDNAPRSKLLGYKHGKGSITSGSTGDRFAELTSICRQVGSIGEAAVMQHPAWLEIVSLGEDVIPFILEMLEQNPTESWFSALQKITGVNPVLAGHTAATDAWLSWGKQRGISWKSMSPTAKTDGVLIREEGDLVIVEVPTKLAKVSPAEAERLAAMLIQASRSITNRKSEG